MGRFTPPFSVTQQKVLAIVPKVTALPSILGSTYIVYHVLSRPSSRGRVYHRLMLSMSFMDLIFSIKSFVSTWPIPKQTLFVWGARGNFDTCTAWGFIGHGSSLSSALYNFSLTLYFLMTITFSWNEQKVRKRLELWFHVVPLAVGWGTAIPCITLDLFNPIGWTCWIGTFPPGCGLFYPCIRGDPDRVDLYRWLFFHAELWFIFVLSTIAMIIMYRSVRQREQASKKYQFSQLSGGSSSATQPRPPEAADSRQQQAVAQPRPRSLAARVAVQAFLYIGCFFITWFWPAVQFIVSQKTGNLYFPLLCCTVIFTPLQGFFDAIIFLRPRYLKYRAQRENSGVQSGVRGIIVAVSRRDDDLVDGEIYDPDSAAEEAQHSNRHETTQALTRNASSSRPVPSEEMEEESQHEEMNQDSP